MTNNTDKNPSDEPSRKGKAADAATQRPSPFGVLKGTVRVAPGVDLTAPTGEIWDAERDGPPDDPVESKRR